MPKNVISSFLSGFTCFPGFAAIATILALAAWWTPHPATAAPLDTLPSLRESAITGQYKPGWQRTTPIVLRNGVNPTKLQVGGSC